jgi:hypothetical protein
MAMQRTIYLAVFGVTALAAITLVPIGSATQAQASLSLEARERAAILSAGETPAAQAGETHEEAKSELVTASAEVQQASAQAKSPAKPAVRSRKADQPAGGNTNARRYLAPTFYGYGSAVGYGRLGSHCRR